MAQNEVIILNSILKEQCSLTSDDFEIFVFEQLLKDYDLSTDEIMSGKTGGGDDGGIDGIFILINSNLIQEKVDKKNFKKPKIDIFIMQAKTVTSFPEDALTKISDSIDNLLDLTKDIKKLESFYNLNIIEKMSIFREICTELATKHPEFAIHYYYATKGDRNDIHPKVKAKSKSLQEKTKQLIDGASAETVFFGARDLLQQYRKEKSYTLQLSFLESFSSGLGNYVMLSDLVDYYNFVTDESGILRRYIFDSNVRDYQGEIEVNMDIQTTLSSNGKSDFWWLNNGITMLASKASITGKTISLDDVQIVNGLQTTRCIYDYLHEKGLTDEESKKRSIIIKIIVTDDTAIRDKIIKATNFQTRIPDASLRATDALQRNIEDYFKSKDWFYDRRKNYYKNIGKPPQKIISISYLAQAIMTLVLKEPHTARGRPSSLIKKDEDYKKVFENKSVELLLKTAQILRKVEDVIKTKNEEIELSKKRNLRFHIALISITNFLKNLDYDINNLKSINIDKLSSDIIETTIDYVVNEAEEYTISKKTTLDKIAKSRGFIDHLKERLSVSSSGSPVK